MNEKQNNEAPKTNNESTVQLTPEEVSNLDGDAYNKLVKDYNDLKNMIVKTYLKKYRIRDAVKINDLNFNSLEDVESSLINYCEKSKINYTKPTNHDYRYQLKDDFAPNAPFKIKKQFSI